MLSEYYYVCIVNRPETSHVMSEVYDSSKKKKKIFTLWTMSFGEKTAASGYLSLDTSKEKSHKQIYTDINVCMCIYMNMNTRNLNDATVKWAVLLCMLLPHLSTEHFPDNPLEGVTERIHSHSIERDCRP